MKKSVGKIIKTIGSIWTTIVFICALALLGLRFAPVPFGYEPIWCMSNSMSPTFHENALCYIDLNYDPNKVEVGDIIAYQLSNGAMVTHRVHDITDEGIITKGDANKNVDFAPVSKEQIIGKNAYQIEHVGVLFKDFPNKLLISCIIFAIAAMLMFDTLSGILLEDEENDDSKKEKSNQVNNVDGSSHCRIDGNVDGGHNALIQ